MNESDWISELANVNYVLADGDGGCNGLLLILLCTAGASTQRTIDSQDLNYYTRKFVIRNHIFINQ